jgi:hypothetical protein
VVVAQADPQCLRCSAGLSREANPENRLAPHFNGCYQDLWVVLRELTRQGFRPLTLTERTRLHREAGATLALEGGWFRRSFPAVGFPG